MRCLSTFWKQAFVSAPTNQLKRRASPTMSTSGSWKRFPPKGLPLDAQTRTAQETKYSPQTRRVVQHGNAGLLEEWCSGSVKNSAPRRPPSWRCPLERRRRLGTTPNPGLAVTWQGTRKEDRIDPDQQVVSRRESDAPVRRDRTQTPHGVGQYIVRKKSGCVWICDGGLTRQSPASAPTYHVPPTHSLSPTAHLDAPDSQWTRSRFHHHHPPHPTPPHQPPQLQSVNWAW
jgi:hypothetical protein